MDDVHRKPKDDERDAVAARIKRVAGAGRISDLDRDIRLGNVRSAQSMWELDLITRELDQLETDMAPGSQEDLPRPAPTPAAGPVVGSEGPTYTTVAGPSTRPAGRTSGKRSGAAAGIIVVVVVAITLLVVGAVVVVSLRTIQGLSEDALNGATGRPGDQSGAEPGAVDSDAARAGAKYALTASGVRGFLQEYRKRFGTNRVVDLTLYGDYAIVNVPKPKSRQEGWVYREASGFSSFGGVRATFPGARPVATNRLAVQALVRNIARARRTLNVERPTQTYVIVRSYPGPDRGPSVNIYVGNKFNESGYLATTLAGKVKSAYPFRRQ